MKQILASDVFPGLDTKDPLLTLEEDSIPKQFLEIESADLVNY